MPITSPMPAGPARPRPLRATLFELRVVDVRVVVYRIADYQPRLRLAANRVGDRLIGTSLAYRGWCTSLVWRRA
jgi:hypothetical protein